MPELIINNKSNVKIQNIVRNHELRLVKSNPAFTYLYT